MTSSSCKPLFSLAPKHCPASGVTMAVAQPEMQFFEVIPRMDGAASDGGRRLRHRGARAGTRRQREHSNLLLRERYLDSCVKQRRIHRDRVFAAQPEVR